MLPRCQAARLSSQIFFFFCYPHKSTLSSNVYDLKSLANDDKFLIFGSTIEASPAPSRPLAKANESEGPRRVGIVDEQGHFIFKKSRRVLLPLTIQWQLETTRA